MPAVHDQSFGADRRGGVQLLLEQLAAGDPDPVIRRGHVDDIRGVHVQIDTRACERRPDLVRLTGEGRGLPALRVAEEELDGFGADRPSALQAYEAGYNPSSARARHGHWFAFLDDVDLLSQQERKAMQRHTDVLDGIEKEQVTKSYKLVTLQALLQMDALRTGADVAEIAWTAHRLVTGDPRLLGDTGAWRRCPTRHQWTPTPGANIG